MNLLKPLFTLLILGLIVYALYQWVIFPFIGGEGFFDAKASVIHVIDPDSIIVMQDGKVKKVQLIGVDAPEKAGSEKCYSYESKKEVAEYFRTEREVTLQSDGELGDTDIYGRFLRYVTLSDGRLLNEEMLKEGLAKEFHSKDSTYSKQEQFEQLEKEAKEDNRGLWEACK